MPEDSNVGMPARPDAGGGDGSIYANPGPGAAGAIPGSATPEGPVPVAVPESGTREALRPLPPAERIPGIDVLRGLAILGILGVNIYAFALPGLAYDNPLVYGGGSGLDLWTWFFTNALISNKFITTFAMLFGAGLVVLMERAAARSEPFGKIYYRRVAWLLIFGLIHAYFVWYGDILVSYALCGLVIYLFRNVRPRNLIVVGAVGILLGIAGSAAVGGMFTYMRRTAEKAEILRSEGKELQEYQKQMEKSWKDMKKEFYPAPQDLDREVRIHRDGYLGIFGHRLPKVLQIQTMGMIFTLFWRLTGLMLIGMALIKMKIFTAERTPLFYRNLALAGLGLGLPLSVLAGWAASQHRFDIIHSFTVTYNIMTVAGLAGALGFTGLVMLWSRSGLLAGLRARLAAVGRTAFSNYLLQSILCTTLFYGYGFGLFGSIPRSGLMAVVLSVWILQLLITPLWLRHFHFGPAEWVWKRMAYRRPVPFRIASSKA